MSKETVKKKFVKGAIPTEEDYAELIDVAGEKGAKGDTGTAGKDGEDGAKGDTGAKGTAGTNGKDGATGPKGADGKDAEDVGTAELDTDAKTIKEAINELFALVSE